jgi:integration host factor subunit beta
MNKLELIQALEDASGLTKTEAESVVNIIFNAMSDTLANGDRVEIRGLCSFMGTGEIHRLFLWSWV